jgi:hypothetical protein
VTTKTDYRFYTLTLNQGEEEPGTRGWSFYNFLEMSTALRAPGIRVILSTDPAIPCRTSVMSENANISITEPCTPEYAIARMIRLMKCYKPQPMLGINMQEFGHGVLKDLMAMQAWMQIQEQNKKQGKTVEDTDNLLFILGLNPATSDNCPNVPADPKLTGDSPFDGQDPMWFDYHQDLE